MTVGLEGLTDAEWTDAFGRFTPLPGQPGPVAMRYHGHQFRSYNPDLGDGRGFLAAQMLETGTGRLLDLATKGSGRTPWSRGADGRLTLKGGVREVLAPLMLEALGVPTSRPFSLIETGEALTRHDEPSPTRSAVLVRLGHSHVRFGTFQRAAYLERRDQIETLIEHVRAHYHPHVAEGDAAGLLAAVVEASARLTARWIAAGFVHGVLNTDNLNVTGESFDYGPWRFLPHYEPGFTAAYFDQTGLYCFARQPEAVFWALQQFAGALAQVGDRLSLEAALNTFPAVYRLALLDAFMARFGLVSAGRDKDEALVRAFLAFMEESRLSWEAVIFDWFGGEASRERAMSGPRAGRYQGETFEAWQAALAGHAPDRPERLDHPCFARSEPVDLVIETVEAVWDRIAEDDDWSVLDVLIADIRETGDAYGLGAGRAGFLQGRDRGR